MIKAIFFDIDGTLLQHGANSIEQEVVDALVALKKKGIQIFICSGRPPIHLQSLPSNLTSLPWSGMVLLNGQYCINDRNEVIHKCPISKEALKELIPWLKSGVDFTSAVFELDHAYDVVPENMKEDYLNGFDKADASATFEDPIRSLTHDTYQICPRFSSERDQEFLEHAPGMKSARWTDAFADMIPIDGGKDVGMKKMLDYYGIKQEETMAFGDAGNDVPMLTYAKIGVVMGNGIDVAKKNADYITTNIDDHGIVNALKHFKLL